MPSLFGVNLRQTAGALVGRVGQKLGVPELGLSERIQGMSNKPKPQVAGAKTTRQPVIPSAPPVATQRTGGTYFSNPTAPATPQPQPAGGGEALGGGDGGGESFDPLGALRNSFNQKRSALEAMIPTYDSDFGNFKTEAEAGIQRAKNTLEAQNQEDERSYGNSLRSLLQTDRELRQRRQGTFSSLNALDSSAYRDDTVKADQELLESTQLLDAEKRRTYKERQDEFAAYEKEAVSKLAHYGNEIQRAKQAMKMAIADVNMDEAASLQNYIDKLMAEAQQVNAGREAMALNLTQLQASGVDVVGNLGKMNMQGFSNIFGDSLRNRINQITARYTLPQTQLPGSGYINPRTGRSFTDEERRLLGI
jgi:hypothetical protein